MYVYVHIYMYICIATWPSGAVGDPTILFPPCDVLWALVAGARLLDLELEDGGRDLPGSPRGRKTETPILDSDTKIWYSMVEYGINMIYSIDPPILSYGVGYPMV